MASREHEAVTVEPVRLVGVVRPARAARRVVASAAGRVSLRVCVCGETSVWARESAHLLAEEDGTDLGAAQGQAHVAGRSLLDRVHGKATRLVRRLPTRVGARVGCCPGAGLGVPGRGVGPRQRCQRVRSNNGAGIARRCSLAAGKLAHAPEGSRTERAGSWEGCCSGARLVGRAQERWRRHLGEGDRLRNKRLGGLHLDGRARVRQLRRHGAGAEARHELKAGGKHVDHGSESEAAHVHTAVSEPSASGLMRNVAQLLQQSGSSAELLARRGRITRL